MCTQVWPSAAMSATATTTPGASRIPHPKNSRKIAQSSPEESRSQCVAKSSSILTLRLTEIQPKCEWSVAVDGTNPVSLINVTSDLVSVAARRCVPVARNTAMIQWLCRRLSHSPHAQDFYCCWVDCYFFEFVLIAPTTSRPSPKYHIACKKINYQIFILLDVSDGVLISNENLGKWGKYSDSRTRLWNSKCL